MKRQPEKLRRIGLVANPDKSRCRAAIQSAARLAARQGLEVWSDPTTLALTGARCRELPSIKAVSRHCDLLLVFGGDGTILRAARETAGSRCPLLGINVGTLGFLTAAPARHLERILPHIWDGAYTVEKRSMIQAQIRGRRRHPTQLALNDFAVNRSAATRLVELDVLVDNQALTRYRCDGLIVSSATGSTAYSLAAGGPIVAPDAEVFALTPISPHTLSNRPLILNLRAHIEIRIISARVQVELSADGQVQTELTSGDAVHIWRSPHRLPLVRPKDVSFFETLRHKLHWSGSPV